MYVYVCVCQSFLFIAIICRFVCRRITFCLDVYNDAVKSMRYPPDAYKKQLKQSKDKTAKQDEKSIEEIMKEMEDDFDE